MKYCTNDAQNKGPQDLNAVQNSCLDLPFKYIVNH